MKKLTIAASIFGFFLDGCTHDPIPFLNGPSPYLAGPGAYLNEGEIDRILSTQDISRSKVELNDFIPDKDARNNFVSAKIFLIDKQYHLYETNLARENEFANLGGSIASLGVSTAGATIPVGQTTKILAAVATGITGAKASFDRDVLLTQTIQAVQSQMRTDRAIQAKVLLSRMSCELNEYPIFMAMSDLEAYRQAGTLESAINSLTKAAAKAEADATSKSSSPKNNAKDKPKDEVEAALAAIANAEKAVSALKRDCPIKGKKSA